MNLNKYIPQKKFFNMTVDVETYLAQLAGAMGKLAAWEAEIFQLYRARVSYQKIATFLALNGVKATKMEVYRFIHRKKRTHLLQAEGDLPAQQTSTQTNCKPEIHSGSEIPGITQEPEQAEDRSQLPKFSWSKNRAKDKPTW